MYAEERGNECELFSFTKGVVINYQRGRAGKISKMIAQTFWPLLKFRPKKSQLSSVHSK